MFSHSPGGRNYNRLPLDCEYAFGENIAPELCIITHQWLDSRVTITLLGSYTRYTQTIMTFLSRAHFNFFHIPPHLPFASLLLFRSLDTHYWNCSHACANVRGSTRSRVQHFQCPY